MDGWIGSLAGYFDGIQFYKGPVSIRVSNGTITDIKFDKINDPLIDGRGKILTPPFTDGHTHLIFAGTRFNELGLKLSGKSYSDILAQGGGIQRTVRLTREADDQKLEHLVKRRLDTMLTHGSLTVEIKSGYGLSTEHELRLLRVLQKVNETHPIDIIPTFGAAHVYPSDMSQDEYVEQIIDEMLPVVAKESLATSTDVFCDRGAFSIADTVEIFEASSKYNLPVKVHAEELEYRGIAKIVSQQFNTLSADHLLHAKKDDFEVLANNNTVAMFMPLAPLGLFTQQYPSGFDFDNLTIGIGSDFNPNNWSISMQTAIRMAVFNYRMTPVDAVKAATSGSFQGVHGVAFSPIQIQSPADFLLISSFSLDEFVSKFGQNLVTHVIKEGNIIHQSDALVV